MTEVVVRLRGIRAHGFHGLEEDERRDGQDFEVDVEFVYEAAAGDTMSGRVDYAETTETVLGVFHREIRRTIESVADEIADAVFHRYRPIRDLVVRVRKRPPSLREKLEVVEVEVRRRR